MGKIDLAGSWSSAMEYSLAGRLDVAAWLDRFPMDCENRLTVLCGSATPSDRREAGVIGKIATQISRRPVQIVCLIGV